MVSVLSNLFAEKTAAEEERRHAIAHPDFYLKPLVWRTTAAYRRALEYVATVQGIVGQAEARLFLGDEVREQFNYGMQKARDVAYFLPDEMRKDIADRVCALLREGIEYLRE